MKTIVEQLSDIYETKEWWHKTRMSHDISLKYHEQQYLNGNIHVYEENNVVLGYYQRFFNGNECILYNVYVKEGCRRGKVFRELYKHFFATMPKNIEFIVGEKQKLGGKLVKAKIRR